MRSRKNRDELKAQIQVIKAEAESNAVNAKMRVQLEEGEVVAQQQRFKVELEAAQAHTKQITIERDELLVKITQLNKVKNTKVEN